MTSNKGFSLVELLVVVAVIGVMVSLVIASFVNAAQDARGAVARQQQVALQNAINAWLAARLADSGETVAGVRTDYNNAPTAWDKFQLFDDYLDDATALHYTAAGSNTRIVTAEMTSGGNYVTLPTWTSGSYPKAEWN